MGDRGYQEPVQPAQWPPSIGHGFNDSMQQQQQQPGWPFNADQQPQQNIFAPPPQNLLPPPQPSPFGPYENNSLLAQAMQMQQALGEAGNAAVQQMQMSALTSMQGPPGQMPYQLTTPPTSAGGFPPVQPLSPLGG